MTLTAPEIAASARLAALNGNTYNASTNPTGLAGVGYKTLMPIAYNDTALLTDAVARLAGDAEDEAIAAAASAAAALASENAAESARDAALAAATSSDFPFATTAGTASAYTVNFSPDRTVADGFSMRCNFHTANNATPTIAVDGGTAYEIVDGLSLASGGAYRPLAAGEILLGMNLVLMFDSRVNKMVITGGFPIYALSRTLEANNNAVNGGFRPFDSLSAAQTFALADAGRLQLLTGSSSYTWTIPTNAAVAFVLGTEIEVYNSSTADLTLQAAGGVTFSGVVAGATMLPPQKGGMIKKIATDSWIWIGFGEVA